MCINARWQNAYDAAGNRTSKTVVQQASPSPVSVTSNYSYDPIYELTQAVVGGSLAESYTYDAVGNRLTSAGPTSYNYNASNELTSTSGAAYTYDNNGNTLSKTDSTGTTNYTWDFENRLTQVTLPGTGGTVNFKYDPFGRRIYKSLSAGTSIYAYDGDNMIEELGGGGNLLAQYTQGANVDEPLALTGAGETYFYHADGLGSITSLTDGSGQLAASYVYDSFGKLTASTGSITNAFQYTGREFDSETSLYYYRARYYGPAAGRFLSEDPLEFRAGNNFYPYVRNNPLIAFDPTGLDPSCTNCKIVVKCRGIESYRLGLLGFEHCDAQVVDANGITHSLSAGPDPASHGELLNAWDTTQNLPPFNGSFTYYDASASCNTAQCLINSTNKFHNETMHFAYIPYGGPNSNTALDSIFGECAIHLNLHWWGPPVFQSPFWRGKGH